MMKPLISVVLATRDRPGLFAEALDSVLAQSWPEIEVIVVNDGSGEDHLPAYRALWDAAAARLGDRFAAHSLVHRPKGHGQSYSLNFGASRARGDYLCFLDDDDKWTDAAHLARAAKAIADESARGRTVDLYMGNQEAWAGERRIGVLWLGTLATELQARGRLPDAAGAYEVTVQDLMQSTGFCHLNVLTVRRELFAGVGGMDEGIRWECDRDLFLKLVDKAQLMIHQPAVVAYHRVPDPSKTSNMTTALAMIEKRLLQALVMDRALARSSNPWIRRHAREHKGYALKKIAVEYASAGDWTNASHYASQAQGAAPTPGWLLYSLRCRWQRLFAAP